jgi:hypothetical protein
VWIYANWLIALSKGPKWTSLNHKKRLQTILKLRDWASKANEKVSDFSQLLNRIYRLKNLEQARDLHPPDELNIPNELLDLVGFTGETPSLLPGHLSSSLGRIEDYFKKGNAHMSKQNNIRNPMLKKEAN